MPLQQILFSIPVLAILSGCVVSTPFETSTGTSASKATVQPGDTVIVALTHAILRDDDAARDRFVAYIEEVERTLPGQPGYIGHAKRIEILGSNAWTMSVWRDSASMRRFVNSEPHATAMKSTFIMLRDAYVAQKKVVWDGGPPDWDEALAILAANGREVYN